MAADKEKKQKITKKLTGSVPVYDVSGTHSEEMSLPEEIFNVTASDRLLAQYIRVYLANQRQGTHKTKRRGEIKATTKKVYRQKGTGRARHGARSAPIFVGGGVAHGVQPKSYTLKLNKKQRKKALYYSLTLKRKDGSTAVLKGIDTLKGTTKEIQHTLIQCGVNKGSKVLLAYGESEKTAPFIHGLGNLNWVTSTHCYLLNAFSVMNAQKIIFTDAGIADFIAFRNIKKS